MPTDAIVDKFDRLSVWSRGDQRAPHKPLLVLYALGQWQQGKTELSFRDVEKDLTLLLREFGPPRKSDHPEQPFWRLKNDGVWSVHGADDLPMKTGDDIPRVTSLRSANVRAGFSDEVQLALRRERGLVSRIASSLLERHFPESLYADIVSAVGLDLGKEEASLKRDPRFRLRVLTAYEWRCAVCGFDVRLGSVSIALDAAHIRWHQAGGPAEENNGLALCVLHHKTFDLGAFTVDASGRMLVSERVNGSTGLDDALLRFHGKTIRSPQRPEWRPSVPHVDWHGREVFKGQARHLGE